MRCLRKVLLNFHQPDGLQVCNECHYSQGQRWIYIFLNLEKNRNKQNHAVSTSMKKAKTFLDDEYLRDLTCASDDQYFYFKCLCYHSFKKIEPPHKLQVALCLVSGVVKYALCTCVAGSVGFCNHVLAVMMKLCKFS